jgi:hypothetical protein
MWLMLLKLGGPVTEVLECLPSKGETLVSKSHYRGGGGKDEGQTDTDIILLCKIIQMP